jgi:spoIIIJ-associated protein
VEWVETTGRTVAEALDVALDQLGVLEEEAEYEVLAEPKAGLFGRFGGSEARLRVRVKPVSREKPGDRRRGRPRRARGEASADAADDPSSGPSRRAGGGRARTSPREGAAAPAPGTGPEGARRRRRGGRGRGRDGSTNGGGASARRTDEGAVMDDQPEIPVEDQADAAEAFVRGLVDAFGVKAEVTSRLDDEILLVEVDGANLGLLVGQKGATLHAIEELVRTVVQRQTGGHGVRIHVDVSGYRAKRREALADFTRRLVDRVLENGRDQVLDPMPPPDRKVVHDTVAEFDGVETASEGEEPRRRVVIRRT